MILHGKIRYIAERVYIRISGEGERYVLQGSYRAGCVSCPWIQVGVDPSGRITSLSDITAVLSFAKSSNMGANSSMSPSISSSVSPTVSERKNQSQRRVKDSMEETNTWYEKVKGYWSWKVDEEVSRATAVRPRMCLVSKGKSTVNVIWPTFSMVLTLAGLHIAFVLQDIDLVFQLQHQHFSSR